MVVYQGLSTVVKESNAVITVGTFDGVHLGHRHLINNLIKRAQLKRRKATLVTFYPHPKHVLNMTKDVKVLTTLKEKLNIFESLNVDRVVVINFDKKFSNASSDFFLEDILYKKIGFKEIVVGYDHTFGKNRTGSLDCINRFISKYDCDAVEVKKFAGEFDFELKSKNIRELVGTGQIKIANTALGYCYFLNANVVRGLGMGGELSFPTANLMVVDAEKLIPANGVYAVSVIWNGSKYSGMMNIGTRPTFKGNNKTLEVHILNFDQNIYGQSVCVQFVERIRDEKKFGNIEELKNQLAKDKEIVLSMVPN